MLVKVAKLFKEYYQDHGDLKTQRQMNLVRDREQRRLKLQMKLLKLRQEKKDAEKNLQQKITSPPASVASTKSIFLRQESDLRIKKQTFDSENIINRAKHNQLFMTQVDTKTKTQNEYEIMTSPTTKTSQKYFMSKTQKQQILQTKTPKQIIQYHKNQLFNNLGLKQAINDLYLRKGTLDLEVQPIKSEPLHMIRSARDLGIENQKLVNLKHLSNMKSHRQYMPLFDNFRFLSLKHRIDQQQSTPIQTLRTRTFNMTLQRRRVIDPRIDSMMITDFNLIGESKFGQSLILNLLRNLQQSLGELSTKLFNNNQTSWSSFTNWLKRTQLTHINIIVEEIIGITLQIGEVLLIKFKDFPEQIGISDPRYILNLDSIVQDEQQVFEDNILKYKEIRQFYNHSFDSYQLMTTQLGYKQISEEELMVMQAQRKPKRLRCSISGRFQEKLRKSLEGGMNQNYSSSLH
eukprot:403373264